MTASPRLSMTGIAKVFGPTAALRGADLAVRPGEIHALIGENGAGKSTLMKVLSGALEPDAGAMRLDGEAYAPRDPAEARRRGVAMVYQELTLAPHLTVAMNVVLGQEPARFGFLRGSEVRRKVRDALAVLEHPEIRAESPVEGLSPAAQQLVEIARAMLVDVRVLVLDEPTSALAAADAHRLFALIRRLRDRGVSVVYISHFLEEVEAVADRYTVLRDGRAVATGVAHEFDRDRIVERMVGRRLDEQFPRVAHETGEPILDLADLSGVELPHSASLSLRRGEILGIAGILGAGRTELLRAIYGLDPIRSGQVVIHSIGPPRGETGVRTRIAQGVGFLSEDRKAEGLALDQTIEDNFTYSRLGAYGPLGWIGMGKRRSAVNGWLARLDVRCAGPTQAVGELSGGNQQKVALGRLLHQRADLLLLDEPTRGIDIGSKAQIYRLIGELAAQGKAVMFVSSYLPELLGVCDRLAVMARGRLSPIRPVADWTPESVMACAAGQENMS
jgi:ribose transport system ATP-binding protein